MISEDDWKPERLPSIDAFRGLAVLMMAVVNYIGGVLWMPSFLKHTPDIGYTVPDVIAPMFIMAVGFTAGLSFRRRKACQGTAATLGGMAARYLAILGIGAVISAGQALCQPGGERLQNWGVLQAIGGAGLLTVIVINTKPWVRVIAGLGLLACFQWLLTDAFIFKTVFESTQNSLIGALSWGGLMILATAAADIFFQAKTTRGKSSALLLSGAAALALGLVLALWFPVSKNRASMTYMLVSLGISLLVLLAFHVLLDGRKPRLALLRAAGRNPLAMYMAHLIILAFYTLPSTPAWYAYAPAWLAALQCAVLLSGLLLLARWMQRKNVVLKL